MDRRDFIKKSILGVVAAFAASSSVGNAFIQESEKLVSILSEEVNHWVICPVNIADVILKIKSFKPSKHLKISEGVSLLGHMGKLPVYVDRYAEPDSLIVSYSRHTQGYLAEDGRTLEPA